MKTIAIVALVLIAVYPWWGPAVGLEIPFLNAFFDAAYEALNA